MIVLVGLGNPGEKHARHRHNVGFMAVDAIGDAHGFGPVRSKFNAEIREGFLDGDSGRVKALIVKPQTFMNESGLAVRKVADFYKLEPQDFVVFYDELDLISGKLRIKTGGGAAGHNGIRSIDAHLGNGFRRVRIGIDHPGDRSKVTSHVLGNFAKADQEWLALMLDAIASAAPYLTTDDQRFASEVGQKTAPIRPEKPRRANADSSKAKPAGDGAASAGEKQPDKAKDAAPASNNPFADALQNLFGRKK
jgi:peptidyl-tRNA hydrolase, PTH1 family